MNKDKYADHDYKKDAELILHDVRQVFCGPCTDPRKKLHTINIDDPLSCDCSCERVEHLLRVANKILDED